MFICYSCSKNFGLYGERTGALFILTQGGSEIAAAASNARSIIRSCYSNPPFHGQRIVQTVLADSKRRADWKGELAAMQARLHEMRKGLMAALHAKTGDRNFNFIGQQKGLFSFIGLKRDQVQRLVGDYAIYTPPSGRINVSGLNSQNLDYVAEAIATVL